jgi:Methyltransferase domain
MDLSTRYKKRGKRGVAGWFTRIDAEIFATLLAFQNEQKIAGSCCEIGVHHGKSFIPLCLCLGKNEFAMCIDVFEEQAKNLDVSGSGDRQLLVRNLVAWGVEIGTRQSFVRIVSESSEEITAERILDDVGPVRFFSIDGGHWETIVKNDLNLASAVLAHGGIIALDDIFRAEWPDVTLAFAAWFNRAGSVPDIVPFACGSNKLYLCNRDFTSTYRECLRTDFLTTFYAKTYKSKYFELDSYKTEIRNWDETDFKGACRTALEVFFPDFRFKLKTGKRAVKRLFRYHLNPG